MDKFLKALHESVIQIIKNEELIKQTENAEKEVSADEQS